MPKSIYECFTKLLNDIPSQGVSDIILCACNIFSFGLSKTAAAEFGFSETQEHNNRLQKIFTPKSVSMESAAESESLTIAAMEHYISEL
jgi:hypothetical protein